MRTGSVAAPWVCDLVSRRVLDRSAKRKRVDVAGCLELAGCEEAIGHNFEPNLRQFQWTKDFLEKMAN